MVIMWKSLQRRRNIFLLVCCCQFFSLGFETAGLQQILQKIGTSFGATQSMLGTLIAMQYLAMMTMPVCVGWVADRMGKRRVAVTACLLFVAGCLSILYAKAWIILGLGIFLCGAGYSICESTGTAAIYDVFQHQASRQISLSQALFSLGGIVSPVLIQRLMNSYKLDWRILFVLLLITNLAVLPFVISFYPQGNGICQAGELERPKAVFFLTPSILLLCASIFVASGLENGYCYYVDLYAMEALHTTSLTATTLSMFWTANVIVRLLYSMLPSRHKLLLLCFGGAAAALSLLAAFPNRGTFVWISAVMGGVLAPMWPAIQSRAMAEFPAHTATVSGVLFIPCGAGSVMLLGLAGVIADHFQAQSVYAVLAFLALGGLVAYGGYVRYKQKHS